MDTMQLYVSSLYDDSVEELEFFSDEWKTGEKKWNQQ